MGLFWLRPVPFPKRGLRDFINNVREKLIEGGFIVRSDLERR
jgi:hypothetical protein